MTTARVAMAGYAIHGKYHGGEYIELSFDGDQGFDVINVWDYAKGKSTIPNTHKAVKAAMIEWRDAAGDSLAHDLREYALSIR